MDSSSNSKHDDAPPAYSASVSSHAPTPAPTPPVLDPYNPYNPYNNPWAAPSSSASSSRQPLLQPGQTQGQGFYAYSDVPQFPNYPRWDGGRGFGPTPSQALFQHGQNANQNQNQVPYAYYDPHSPYSISRADARARKRFLIAMMWVLGVWVLIGVLVRGFVEGWFDPLVEEVGEVMEGVGAWWEAFVKWLGRGYD